MDISNLTVVIIILYFIFGYYIHEILFPYDTNEVFYILFSIFWFPTLLLFILISIILYMVKLIVKIEEKIK